MASMWRYQRFHVSYLFAWCAGGILGGLVLSAYVQLAFSIAWVMLMLILVSWSLYSRRWSACIVIVLAGLLAGILQGSAFFYDLQQTKMLIGATVSITGDIADDPTTNVSENVWSVRLEALSVDQKRYTGVVYATILSEDILHRGDTVTIQATLREGFGGFIATAYRAKLSAHHKHKDIFLEIRDRFAKAVRTVMPEPEASLGLGFLVGQKSAVPDDLSEAMRTVGLTHIVVASGYNLTILVRFVRRVLGRFSRYLAVVGSIVLIGGFIGVSGMSPSMSRAAIVTILSLLAWYYGRRFHPLHLILYVAAGSAWLYPMYAWADLGWQLSFAAFFGVLIVGPIIARSIYGNKRSPSALVQLVIETVSALVMTLPLTVVVFGYIPVLSLVANILVVPTIPFAMLAVFVAGCVGFLGSCLQFIAVPASILTAYTVGIADFLSSMTWSKIEVTVAPWVAVLWYGAVLLLIGLLWHKKHIDIRGSSVVD